MKHVSLGEMHENKYIHSFRHSVSVISVEWILCFILIYNHFVDSKRDGVCVNQLKVAL